MPALPPENDLTICFAHAAYQLQAEFKRARPCRRSFEVRSLDELKARAAEADVLVVSGLWRNELIAVARSCVSSSRSAPAPTSTTRRPSPRRAFASPAPRAPMSAPSPNMRWR